MEIQEQLDVLENWDYENEEVVNKILKQYKINYSYEELNDEIIDEIIDEIKCYYPLLFED